MFLTYSRPYNHNTRARVSHHQLIFAQLLGLHGTAFPLCWRAWHPDVSEIASLYGLPPLLAGDSLIYYSGVYHMHFVRIH